MDDDWFSNTSNLLKKHMVLKIIVPSTSQPTGAVKLRIRIGENLFEEVHGHQEIPGVKPIRGGPRYYRLFSSKGTTALIGRS